MKKLASLSVLFCLVLAFTSCSSDDEGTTPPPQEPGLTAAAKGLGVSRNTAHSQLKSVFLKTGTRSQGELLRLILGTIAPVEQPDTASGFYPAIHDPEAERD